MYEEFNLYFSDLNHDAQARLLAAVGEKDPKEMNWDMDIFPIAVYCFEKDPDEEELTDILY